MMAKSSKIVALKRGEIVDIVVHGLGVSGEGVGRINGFTVFVDGALPQEKITAKIEDVKPKYAKARLTQIVDVNSQRISPMCSRYEECGGCHIMHLSYEAQLTHKTQIVIDAMERIGGIKNANILPCIPSPAQVHYRNKIQLPVAMMNEQVVSGFYRRGSHDIVPYDKCHVHHEAMDETVHGIHQLLQASAIQPYDEKTTKGTLRHLIIRANNVGEQLIGIVTTGRQKTETKVLADQIKKFLPRVVGVVLSINSKADNAILGNRSHTLCGQPFLVEELMGLQFKISLESFFQINRAAVEILYNTALNYANINADSIVLDAYCGIGTMSLLAARRARRVIGAEVVAQAVSDAKENAQRNQLTNVEFLVAKVEERTDLFREIDVALINPPRKGLDNNVVRALNAHGPERIVYVSCNPATLARDIRGLDSYQLIKVQPVDMFPQTMHVESVALLTR